MIFLDRSNVYLFQKGQRMVRHDKFLLCKLAKTKKEMKREQPHPFLKRELIYLYYFITEDFIVPSSPLFN